MSILGVLRPDRVAVALGTGFSRFDSPVGVGGLCKVTDGRLEILAVHSNHPGCGHFAEFIRLVKKEYSPILIWHVTNEILDDCLPRYGFRKWEERQQIAGEWEHMEGYRWDE